jgi:putative ABC transport system ATP-binding protein
MSLKVEMAEIEVTWKGLDRPLFNLEKLEIEAGSKVLIRGSSGRGKTTLLHLMAGLFLSTKGSVRVGKTRLNELNDEERCEFRSQNLGMIFQKLNLLDHLTAKENIMLPRKHLQANSDGDSANQSATEALKRLGLTQIQNRRAALLSLGEQQRVAAARALASAPKLILADEPTSSLDDENARAVIEAIFLAKDCTTVIVSHDHRLDSFSNRGFDQILDFERLVRT